jgi:hypothetical protein
MSAVIHISTVSTKKEEKNQKKKETTTTANLNSLPECLDKREQSTAPTAVRRLITAAKAAI